MKSFLGFLMVMCYVILAMRPSTPWVEYSLKKSYIIQKLCENRDRPVMKCDGKCYLSKRLKQAAGKEGATPYSQQEIVVPIHLANEVSTISSPLDTYSIDFVRNRNLLALHQNEPPVPPPQV